MLSLEATAMAGAMPSLEDVAIAVALIAMQAGAVTAEDKYTAVAVMPVGNTSTEADSHITVVADTTPAAVIMAADTTEGLTATAMASASVSDITARPMRMATLTVPVTAIRAVTMTAGAVGFPIPAATRLTVIKPIPC